MSLLSFSSITVVSPCGPCMIFFVELSAFCVYSLVVPASDLQFPWTLGASFEKACNANEKMGRLENAVRYISGCC
ncbi:hypothetical protein GYMLUDRAFT_45400 [Collybiopsis luxurians FD-317 M1]|uniref:Uncharacterized protein n=1 Tax=Collybiopsis luxurians FD-317 M1 TaxID=944289 RepID=A0A0D0CRG4_9AGAR|nr:hypothetical protein GYMLUDRAFT_45400 [Collybiopsis luxurians FD-317 M1]